MTQSSSATPQAGDHGRPRTVVASVSRVGIRMLAALALITGSAAVVGVTSAAPAFAADGACDGVTVVVDLTDLGGDLEVACAEGEQENGRSALLAAGFTATDSQPGFLCAINSMPDPCPETFDGNFWSYWNSAPDGEWESYQVGADSSTPAIGQIEGWRYNDGTTPPGIAPSAAADALPATAPEPDASESADEAESGNDEAVTTSSPLAEQQAGQTMVLTIVTVSFLALIAIFVLFFIVRRRRHGRNAPGAGSSD